jgi:hypothetical protein
VGRLRTSDEPATKVNDYFVDFVKPSSSKSAISLCLCMKLGNPVSISHITDKFVAERFLLTLDGWAYIRSTDQNESLR